MRNLGLIREDVNAVAKGEKVIVDQSGFHSTKAVSNTTVIGEKMAVNAEAGVSGSRKFTYDSKTKMHAKSVLVIATQEGTTVEQDGSKFTIISDKPTTTVIQLGTGKKGEIGGLTKKDELDIYMASLNSAGCSPISNKVSVIIP